MTKFFHLCTFLPSYFYHRLSYSSTCFPSHTASRSFFRLPVGLHLLPALDLLMYKIFNTKIIYLLLFIFSCPTFVLLPFHVLFGLLTLLRTLFRSAPLSLSHHDYFTRPVRLLAGFSRVLLQLVMYKSCHSASRTVRAP